MAYGFNNDKSKVTVAPLASPTFTGTPTTNNTTTMTAMLRNITISTSEPTSTDGNNGDIWLVYEA